METKATQAQRVLDYIGEFGGITPLEAMRDLGVYRLASRISDLKRAGHHIESEFVAVPNRYGGKSNVKRYSLGGEG